MKIVNLKMLLRLKSLEYEVCSLKSLLTLERFSPSAAGFTQDKEIHGNGWNEPWGSKDRNRGRTTSTGLYLGTNDSIQLCCYFMLR